MGKTSVGIIYADETIQMENKKDYFTMTLIHDVYMPGAVETFGAEVKNSFQCGVQVVY